VRPLWLLAAAAGFGLIFAATELVHRRGVPAESTRRGAHMAGAGGAALVQLLLTWPEMVAVAAGFTALLAGTRVLGRLRSIHAVTRPSLGAQLLPVGLLLAIGAGWQHPAATAFGMLVLAFADPLAAFAGSVRGPTWRVPGGRKSLWGSLAFLATALGLGAVFGVAGGGLRPLGAATTAAALTLVEAGAGFGLDNLLLPALGTLAGRAWLAL
jgi:dolichol kinase